MSIFLTGSSGFIGRNIICYYSDTLNIKQYKKNSNIQINEKIVVHLAGIAHDINKYLSSDIYYEVNTELTKKIFDKFISSKAEIFIFVSSVKAVADSVEEILTENVSPKPKTHYGKSKLLAEQYIMSKKTPKNKRIYILRPCMIHGPNNKGNLNLLYKFCSIRIPWILGSYSNMRSYCSIDNFLFVINELIHNKNIPSGIYNVADNGYLSTNQVILLIAKAKKIKINILEIKPFIIGFIAKIGDIIPLPINSDRLYKLTKSYKVCNKKLQSAIGKELPLSIEEGLIKTFKSF